MMNAFRDKSIASHDYSKWGINEFKKHFGKQGIEPIDDETFMQHYRITGIGGILREIGRRNDREDIEYLLKIAMTMARKMAGKLQGYWLKEREERKH